MEYLKKFNITDEQIKEIKGLYNEEIIKFLVENEIFVTETILYLYSENIKNIYILMSSNIKIFLETKVALKRTIERLKQKGYSNKSIQMILIEDIEI